MGLWGVSNVCYLYTELLCMESQVCDNLLHEVVNTVILLFHWDLPLWICIVNGSHRSTQLWNKLWECAVWLKICTETLSVFSGLFRVTFLPCCSYSLLLSSVWNQFIFYKHQGGDHRVQITLLLRRKNMAQITAPLNTNAPILQQPLRHRGYVALGWASRSTTAEKRMMMKILMTTQTRTTSWRKQQRSQK